MSALGRALHLIRAPGRRVHRAVGHRRFVRSLRADDRFVATYPKSGTNWVAFFLACALTRDEAAEVRERIDLITYRKWVPDINREYNRGLPLDAHVDLPSPRYFSFHAQYDRTLAKVVNVVRDPRDVLVSYFHHRRRVEADFHDSLETFVAENRMRPSDWGEHVSGWLRGAKSGRVLVTRYEDLQADPVAEFSRIATFCGLGLTQDELEDCVQRASFDQMRAKERWDPEFERARPIAFIRKGKVGGWRDELSDETVALIENRYRELMSALGYELSR